LAEVQQSAGSSPSAEAQQLAEAQQSAGSSPSAEAQQLAGSSPSAEAQQSSGSAAQHATVKVGAHVAADLDAATGGVSKSPGLHSAAVATAAEAQATAAAARATSWPLVVVALSSASSLGGTFYIMLGAAVLAMGGYAFSRRRAPVFTGRRRRAGRMA
jgi:hypothetical protein